MDTSILKVFGARLRADLERSGTSVPHGHALDLVAALAGLRNWPEVNAFASRIANMPFDGEACQRLATRLTKRYGRVFQADALRQVLETPLPERKQPKAEKKSVQACTSGERVLTYVETDEQTDKPTGRRASFSGVEFQPLGYSDLMGLKSRNVQIPLQWRNARVVESTIPEITVDDMVRGSAPLASHFSAKTIGIVKGGWLPSGLALQEDMIVLPDRCTVSELFARFTDGAKSTAADDDFLDLFAGHRVRINPLLFALEGNARRNPTPELVAQQFEEASRKIKAALPLAEIVPTGTGNLRGITGIVDDTRPGMQRKQAFLMELHPSLCAPVSARRLPGLWDWVLETADRFAVPRRSLVVLAALSAIAVPGGKSPAKRLLKLAEPKYSAELAYNALADLRSLEILMSLFAMFPRERLLLCTGDKDLALFWAGIRASSFSQRDGLFEMKFSPTEALLPNVSPEQRAAYFRG